MIGVILAGGRSSRMGRDKAAVEVAGRPMLAWVTTALEKVCQKVVVAGRPIDGFESVPDLGERYRGPLAGLVAAMGRYPGTNIALTAVDQPWINAETLRRLAGEVQDLSVVPVDSGVRQTTCAVYPAAVAPTAAAELEAGGSLQSLLDVVAFQPVVDWRVWGEDGRSWFSVDTPADAKAGLERFGPPA